MTELEWTELNHLRNEISYNPAAVVPKEQEKFTRLFVETLRGKGDVRSLQRGSPCYPKS
jgi:hypothetical protein